MAKFIKYFPVFAIIIFSGCKKYDVKGLLFPNGANQDIETRFAQSVEWNNSHAEIAVSVPSGDYRFYEGADIHTETTTKNLTAMLNSARNDSAAAFVVLVGDLINQRGAFDVFAPALNFDGTTQKYDNHTFTVIGNHDLFFGQWYDYKRYFGTSVYTFEVVFPSGRDLFIVLDSANGTLGKSQLKWLKNILKSRANYRHCIIFTHTNIFKMNLPQGTSNMPLEESYELLDLFAKNNVTMHVSAHVHTYGADVYRDVLYVTGVALSDSDKEAGYLIFDVSEKIDIEKRFF